MLVSIWGRDGSGKSTLADMLGLLFSRHGLTAVIDTDLTQPTLPVRLSGVKLEYERSLGRAVAGAGTLDARQYLHQHPKHQSLFYAGLTMGDEYLAYEIGLEAADTVKTFAENCMEVMDNIILDCSSQRTDPFVPGALMNSDAVVMLSTPDLQGVCWYHAVKPMLERMNLDKRFIHVVSPVYKHHNTQWVQDAVGIRFTAELPFARELNELRGMGKLPDKVTTPAAIAWNRHVLKLYDSIQMMRREDA